jgi:hypothetical protein
MPGTIAMSNIDDAYRRFCRKRFPSPLKEQVADLEDRLGVTFPSDYRSYILEYNGGFFTEPDIVPPTKECLLDSLAFMSGIGASIPGAELGSDTNLFDDNDPLQILPIGYTLGNHLLFIVIDPTDELPESIGMKIAFRDKSFWLADNIEEFFGLLRQ